MLKQTINAFAKFAAILSIITLVNLTFNENAFANGNEGIQDGITSFCDEENNCIDPDSIAADVDPDVVAKEHAGQIPLPKDYDHKTPYNNAKNIVYEYKDKTETSPPTNINDHTIISQYYDEASGTHFVVLRETINMNYQDHAHMQAHSEKVTKLDGLKSQFSSSTTKLKYINAQIKELYIKEFTVETTGWFGRTNKKEPDTTNLTTQDFIKALAKKLSEASSTQKAEFVRLTQERDVEITNIKKLSGEIRTIKNSTGKSTDKSAENSSSVGTSSSHNSVYEESLIKKRSNLEQSINQDIQSGKLEAEEFKKKYNFDTNTKVNTIKSSLEREINSIDNEISQLRQKLSDAEALKTNPRMLKEAQDRVTTTTTALDKANQEQRNANNKVQKTKSDSDKRSANEAAQAQAQANQNKKDAEARLKYLKSLKQNGDTPIRKSIEDKQRTKQDKEKQLKELQPILDKQGQIQTQLRELKTLDAEIKRHPDERLKKGQSSTPGSKPDSERATPNSGSKPNAGDQPNASGATSEEKSSTPEFKPETKKSTKHLRGNAPTRKPAVVSSGSSSSAPKPAVAGGENSSSAPKPAVAGGESNSPAPKPNTINGGNSAPTSTLDQYNKALLED